MRRRRAGAEARFARAFARVLDLTALTMTAEEFAEAHFTLLVVRVLT